MRGLATIDSVADAAGHRAWLDDRGVVAVSGSGAESFLQGLVTNDVTGLTVGTARYAALLTPQGKILFDFLLTRDADGGFLLDCPRAAAADLTKRLRFYKLRAKVDVEDRSDALALLAVWDGDETPPPEPDRIAYADPRHPGLGRRFIVPAGARGQSPATADYERHRLALGIPKGGLDFVYGDAFPHEANLDRLHGLDFHKGCYVGQEVVSRVEHRGLARKRIVPVRFDAPAPAPGSEVFAGDTSVGHMGSAVAGRGLAMLRLDRVEQARANGTPLIAGATPLRLEQETTSGAP